LTPPPPLTGQSIVCPLPAGRNLRWRASFPPAPSAQQLFAPFSRSPHSALHCQALHPAFCRFGPREIPRLRDSGHRERSSFVSGSFLSCSPRHLPLRRHVRMTAEARPLAPVPSPTSSLSFFFLTISSDSSPHPRPLPSAVA